MERDGQRRISQRTKHPTKEKEKLQRKHIYEKST